MKSKSFGVQNLTRYSFKSSLILRVFSLVTLLEEILLTGEIREIFVSLKDNIKFGTILMCIAQSKTMNEILWKVNVMYRRLTIVFDSCESGSPKY